MLSLPSDLTINAESATKRVEALEDRRERALANLLINSALFAVNEGELPTHPIDLNYLVSMARFCYSKKEILHSIINGDELDLNWHDSDEFLPRGTTVLEPKPQ